jgi:hypothetical protein
MAGLTSRRGGAAEAALANKVAGPIPAKATSISSTQQKTLRYPSSIGTNRMPHMIFTAVEASYNVEGKGLAMDKAQNVALYLPIGHSVKDSMSWEQTNGGLTASIFKAAAGSYDAAKASGQDVGTAMAADFAEKTKAAAPAIAMSAGGQAMGAAGMAMAGHKIGGVVAAITGGAIGAAAISGTIDYGKKGVQQVLKDNPFMTFSGVNLRQFSWTFLFYPETSTEASNCSSIVRWFRKHMYPAQLGGEFGFALKYPPVFKIEFQNAHYHKLPELALEDVSVTYNKNAPSFFNDDTPVQFEMSLSFKELTPLYKNHINQLDKNNQGF